MVKGEKMKKRVFLMMALILMIVVSSYAYDDGDFQIWNTDVEEFKIDKDSKIALEEELRWADNTEEFYYHHYDVGFFSKRVLNSRWRVPPYL